MLFVVCILWSTAEYDSWFIWRSKNGTQSAALVHYSWNHLCFSAFLLFCFSAFRCLKCPKLYLRALPECSLWWLHLTLFCLIILSLFLSHSIICPAGSSFHTVSHWTEGKNLGFKQYQVCAAMQLERFCTVRSVGLISSILWNLTTQTPFKPTAAYDYSVLISLNSYFL